jgi:hypothetical protein
MVFRIRLFAIAFFSLCVSFSTAQADFMWNTIPNYGDTLIFHITNFEPSLGVVDAGGDGSAGSGGNLFGVGVIDQILDQTTGGNVVWSKGGTQQLTFTFNNFATNGTDLAGAINFFSGGNVNVYYSDPTMGATVIDENAAQLEGSNSTPDPTGTFSQGTLMFSMTGNANAFAGGHDILNNPIPAGTVLESTVTDPNPATFAGSGSGFFDVTQNGAPLASQLNGNGEPGGSDLKLATTLDANLAGNNANIIAGSETYYPVHSSDPLTGQFTGVPEPTSLAVWSALAGAFAIMRRRRGRN